MTIAATYIDSKTFSVAGDQTIEFHAGRRVKLVGSTNWYGTIESSSFFSVTTVVLTDASDNIDASLTEVYYGILSSTEASSSIPIHYHDIDEGSGGRITHSNLIDAGTKSHSEIDTHLGSTSNPHSVTKTQVGLSNVPNTDFTTAVGLNTTHRTTTSGNPHSVTKADVGLGNVPNTDFTSDVNANTAARHSHTNKAILDNISAAYTTTESGKLAGIEAGADVTSTHETSHADVLVDGDFTSDGFMKRTGAGTYAIDSATYEPAFTKNTAFNKNFGSTSGTVTQGNDSRLSDSRTPTAHDLAGSLHNSATLAQINAKISDADLVSTTDSRLTDARTPVSHNNTYHSQTYITTSGVTYEALDANGDVGSSSGQLAIGNHVHSGVYEPANSNIQNHISNTTGNPHSVTKSQVGLGSVPNTDFTTPVSLNTTHRTSNGSDHSYINQDVTTSGSPTFNGVQFNNNLGSNPTHSEGLVFYDKIKKAVSYYNEETDVTVNLGQELLIRVKNETGSPITNGSVVYLSGVCEVCGEVLVDLALARDKDKSRLVGVITHTIENNSIGYVTRLGQVADVDTTGLTTGSVLYLSQSVPGALTTSLPTDGSFVTIIGVVKEVGVNGSIIVDPTTTHLTVEVDGTNGFPPEQRTNTTLAFDNSTRTFTISPVSGSFHYYVDGIKYEKSSPETIQIDDTEGFWAIYFDGNTITKLYAPTAGQADELFRTKATITFLYWDATNNVRTYFADERHGISMNPVTHAYLHYTRGAQFLEGLGLTGFVVDGNGSLNTHAQFGYGSGVITDEDLPTTISGAASTVGLPIYYLSGANADIRRVTQTGYSVYATGSANGRIFYNQYTGGAWQLTEVTNNYYTLYHIFAINGVTGTDQMISIMGQSEYNLVASARAAASTEITNILVMFPFQEIVPIGTVIFRTGTAYTNAVKAAVISTAEGTNYVDWRVSELAQGSAPSNHNNLINLQYASTGISWGHINDQAQTLAGIKTFSEFPLTPSSAPTTDYQVANRKFVTDNTHTRAHSITSVNDHNASNWKVFYSNGSGQIVELTLGDDGTFLKSNGATSAPTFATASTGGVTDHGALTGLSDDDHSAVYISKTNTTSFTPSADYHPATKKYADDLKSDVIVDGDFTSNGFMKRTGAGTYTVDTSTYSISTHDHSGTYEPAFAKNNAFNKNFGTTSGTVCAGDDTRLSDARTPANHNLISTTNHTVSGLTAGHYIRATGATTYDFAAIQAADVPTLNQNTTGTAASATDCSRSINAGTGLTGGGALNADRTLSVVFGTTSGTVCAGDDGRLSDARTPTSHSNTAHSETYITSAGVTYEALATNGDVGTTASTLASGNHNHSGVYEPADATILKQADVDDTPVDGVTTAPVSSNWAYDHNANANAHHNRSHAITSTSDHTAGNYKVFYSDGSGNVTELPLSTSGTVLTSNGASTAPVFATVSASAGLNNIVEDTTPQLGGDLDANGHAMVAADHGTASTAQVVNVVYGTGSAPTASTTTEGTLFIKYTA